MGLRKLKWLEPPANTPPNQMQDTSANTLLSELTRERETRAAGGEPDDKPVWLRDAEEDLRATRDNSPPAVERSSSEVCAICFEALGGGEVALNCGHKFHGKCVVPWLQHANTCPTCRDEPTRTVTFARDVATAPRSTARSWQLPLVQTIAAVSFVLGGIYLFLPYNVQIGMWMGIIFVLCMVAISRLKGRARRHGHDDLAPHELVMANISFAFGCTSLFLPYGVQIGVWGGMIMVLCMGVAADRWERVQRRASHRAHYN